MARDLNPKQRVRQPAIHQSEARVHAERKIKMHCADAASRSDANPPEDEIQDVLRYLPTWQLRIASNVAFP
jgi:hypothetical protein